MATQIRTVEARSKLKARTPPYWVTLSDGMAIGFRKMSPASEGNWLAQYYDSSTRKQTRKALGSFDHLPLISVTMRPRKRLRHGLST